MNSSFVAMPNCLIIMSTFTRAKQSVARSVRWLQWKPNIVSYSSESESYTKHIPHSRIKIIAVFVGDQGVVVL